MKHEFHEDISIDLTPLIDVVFMLLIFFIMTATFSKPVIDVILPSSKTAEKVEQITKEVAVSVTSKGEIYYNNKLISENELVEILQAEGNSILNMFIDKTAPFEVFVRMADIAREKNNGRFVISTDVTARETNDNAK